MPSEGRAFVSVSLITDNLALSPARRPDPFPLKDSAYLS